MTNREIKQHKDDLATILKELRYEEETKLGQHIQKLAHGVKKLQKLSEVIGARRYLGTGLGRMDAILACTEREAGEKYSGFDAKNESETYECICKEISDNILYKLQTEMMFNACVSAKWSCLCAAVAAIAACISIGLTWWLD